MQTILDLILTILLYLSFGGGMLSAYALYLHHYEGLDREDVDLDGILWIVLFWPVLLAFLFLFVIVRTILWIVIKTEQTRNYARGWIVQE